MFKMVFKDVENSVKGNVMEVPFKLGNQEEFMWKGLKPGSVPKILFQEQQKISIKDYNIAYDSYNSPYSLLLWESGDNSLSWARLENGSVSIDFKNKNSNNSYSVVFKPDFDNSNDYDIVEHLISYSDLNGFDFDGMSHILSKLAQLENLYHSIKFVKTDKEALSSACQDKLNNNFDKADKIMDSLIRIFNKTLESYPVSNNLSNNLWSFLNKIE